MAGLPPDRRPLPKCNCYLRRADGSHTRKCCSTYARTNVCPMWTDEDEARWLEENNVLNEGSSPVTDNFDYDQLDPGIRKTVKMFRDAGFRTTDSGDGCSKPNDPGEVLPFAHVHIAVGGGPGRTLSSEADDVEQAALAVTLSHRLYDVLRQIGISFRPHHYNTLDKVPSIQLTYGYPDRILILSVYNVDDELLADAAAGRFDKEP